jgi:predicted nucleotidyltransferase
MTDMLLDISGKIDEPTVIALSVVKSAADKLGVPFFIELYSSEQELMIEERFDSKMATIRLLGRDMARVAGSPTGRLILSILDDETGGESQLKLAVHMAREERLTDTELKEIEAKICKLKQGFMDGGQGAES